MREPLRLEPPTRFRHLSGHLVDTTELFRLPRDFVHPAMDLFDALETRRSRRSFDPISIQDVSTLLWFSRRHVGTLPHSSAMYPTPTAGALAGVQVVVASRDGGAWGYEPHGHMAYHISTDESVLTRIAGSAKEHFDCTDATILLFAANADYVAQYYAFPESLLLREAGALCLAMQLLAEPLALSFCALGTLGTDWLRSLLGESPYSLISLGAAALGRRQSTPVTWSHPESH